MAPSLSLLLTAYGLAKVKLCLCVCFSLYEVRAHSLPRVLFARAEHYSNPSLLVRGMLGSSFTDIISEMSIHCRDRDVCLSVASGAENDFYSVQ